MYKWKYFSSRNCQRSVTLQSQQIACGVVNVLVLDGLYIQLSKNKVVNIGGYNSKTLFSWLIVWFIYGITSYDRYISGISGREQLTNLTHSALY